MRSFQSGFTYLIPVTDEQIQGLLRWRVTFMAQSADILSLLNTHHVLSILPDAGAERIERQSLD